MGRDAALPQWLAFLRSHGAHVRAHSTATLLAHLLGTRELLIDWQARPILWRVGLFHSVYGTESVGDGIVPVSMRHVVRARIGREAEALTYLFGAVTTRSLHAALDDPQTALLDDRFTGRQVAIGAGTWRDLFEVFVANALEQLPRLPAEMRATVAAASLRFVPHLSPRAAAAARAWDWMTRAGS